MKNILEMTAKSCVAVADSPTAASAAVSYLWSKKKKDNLETKQKQVLEYWTHVALLWRVNHFVSAICLIYVLSAVRG